MDADELVVFRAFEEGGRPSRNVSTWQWEGEGRSHQGLN